MTSIRREFLNENKENVAILITHDYRGITIAVFGPIEMSTTYTPMEAKVICELLTLLEPSYVKPNKSE